MLFYVLDDGQIAIIVNFQFTVFCGEKLHGKALYPHVHLALNAQKNDERQINWQ